MKFIVTKDKKRIKVRLYVYPTWEVSFNRKRMSKKKLKRAIDIIKIKTIESVIKTKKVVNE